MDTNLNVFVTGFSTNDFATVKLSSTGSNVWVRTHDRAGHADQSLAVAISPDGNSIYVAHLEHGSCGDPLHCGEGFAVFGYSQTGQDLWTNGLCGLCSISPPNMFITEIKGLVVSGNGYIYMTGNRFGGTYYTVKLSSNGQVANVYEYAHRLGHAVQAMVMGGGGSIYLTGANNLDEFQHTDALTLRLDGDLSQQWATAYHGVDPGYHQCNAIAVDALGNAYVTGQTAVGVPGYAPNDWFTIKYDPAGREQWVQRYNGPANGEDIASAIAVDASGVYVAGSSTTTNGLIDLAGC